MTADILMLQREVPQEINKLAAQCAQAHGCKVILDMGGKDEPLDKELLRSVDIISPNETELGRILGTKDLAIESDAEAEKCIK